MYLKEKYEKILNMIQGILFIKSFGVSGEAETPLCVCVRSIWGEQDPPVLPVVSIVVPFWGVPYRTLIIYFVGTTMETIGIYD